MKNIFFFAILILLPVTVLGGGLIYLVWHTCYSLYDDWQLNQELDEIRAASREKRSQAGTDRPSGGGSAGGHSSDDETSSRTVGGGDFEIPGDDV